MSSLARPFTWFYVEFGIRSIHETGRNAYLIILARSCRMFAYGATFILALFLAELKFSDYQIGLFMTLTLVGDVFLGTFLTLIADRVGRRKILVGGSFLMVWSGIAFAYFENFWMLLFGAVIGVISATGGDFGPFRSIEESILSHLTTPQTRADVLSWYVTTSTFGVALGSEASGRIVHYLQGLDGWTLTSAYHSLFWMYAVFGGVNAAIGLLLTAECEIQSDETGSYAQLAQDESVSSNTGHPQNSSSAGKSNPVGKANLWRRISSWLSNNLSQISGPTRSVMYKLWLLLALDSVADGMVPYNLTNYYLDEKFHPSKKALGDATSASYILGTISAVFAGPLSRKIGLINTMVFTHIPSSAAVLAFPFPDSLWLTIILLFVRTGLNNMDQAPRAAFIAAVVKPEERTAVMGITGMLRTLAAVSGPSITGILAGNDRFWIAFVAAGAFRLAYDVGLYALFINMKLHSHEIKQAPVDDVESLVRDTDHHGEDDIETALEMQSLASSSDDEGEWKKGAQ
ncbi:MFS general substrate transporter [Polychaeton citri CBS 116435]|uniref:MFS general substrate transporter n=1 Tax=Polychaeton citri CBS 116435 TaxID=1314669 RepID=A0A9P4QD77_9PEZI|nr:MFS general substrate transporter [Polychaeton citri CBS 116435]